jgi:hydrogenase nickel incorporation protein HypA/HybF
MHETSIAQRMVEVALDAAEKNGGGRVLALRLQLGELSGVEFDTLVFAFDVATRGPAAEKCRVEIERVPARLRCWTCGNERGGALYDACPSCGSAGGDILAGRELRILSIDVDDGSAAHASTAGET